MKHLYNYITEALIKKHVSAVTHPNVDLGLPSGNLWAEYNLGANKPEEYGGYYMWGSISDNSNSNCNWKNAPFNNGDQDYNELSWDKDKPYVIDADNNLLPDSDIAHLTLGEKWYIPTTKDFKELLDGTTYKEYSLNGIRGIMFTSKKNDNTLFIPAAGYREDNIVNCKNSDVCVWTSTHDHRKNYSDCAFYLNFDKNDKGVYHCYRYDGHSIRPVYKKK